jgi:hypothetical protein
MRLTNLLALLAAIVAVSVVAAPPALADSTLEATDEATGNHCGAVTVNDHQVSGGCGPGHAVSTGSITLRAHIFGIESTDNVCTNEFDGRGDENADGYIYNQHLEGATCSREPCEEANGHAKPWRVIGREDANGTEYGRVVFCISTTADMTDRPQCTVDVPGIQTSHSTGEAGNTGGVEMPGIGPAGFRCELIGHWVNESTSPEVEVTHTDDV